MKRCIAIILVLMMTVTFVGTAAAEKPRISISDLTREYAQTCKRGDRGSHVTRVQQMLLRLGYLNGEADGVFGAQTEKSVKQFQKDMGLVADGVVSTAVLDELGDKYTSNTDPSTQVVFGFCNWKEASRDTLDFRVQLTSLADVCYDAITMAYYCEDEYGFRVYPYDEDYVQTLTTRMDMEYGLRQYTDYIRLESCSRIANVYVAVWAVEDCGEITQVPWEELYYLCYPVNN